MGALRRILTFFRKKNNVWSSFLLLYMLSFSLVLIPLTCDVSPEDVAGIKSNAEGKVIFWEYNVKLIVREDGSIVITEVMHIEFQAESGEFKYGYRELMLIGYDAIENVSVYEVSNGILKPLSIKKVTKFGKVIIVWFFDPIKRGEKTFLINYVAINALWEENNKNILKWKLFPESHPKIHNTTAEILIPQSAEPITFSFSPSVPYDIVNNSKYVVIKTSGDLSEDKTISITAYFRKIAEVKYTLNKILYHRPYIFLAEIILTVLFLGISCLRFLYNNTSIGTFSLSMILNELLPPEFAYLARRESFINLCAILDLARKGIITIRIKEDGIEILRKKRPKELFNGELDPIYHKFYRNLKKKKTYNFMDLNSIPGIELNNIVDNLIKKGYLLRGWDEVNAKIHLISLLIILVFYSLLTILPLLNVPIQNIIIPVLFASLGMTSSFLILMLSDSPISRKGKTALNRMKSLITDSIALISIRKITTDRIQELLNNIFNDYLPYLIIYNDELLMLLRGIKPSDSGLISIKTFYLIFSDLSEPNVSITDFLASIKRFIENISISAREAASRSEGRDDSWSNSRFDFDIDIGDFGGGGSIGFG